ncbi:MAG: antibiotic biosynthesis monooxygenase family protein [Agromyces sp.]
MIACQFIFQPGTYDDEFQRLDDAIEEYAQAMPGYIGVDRWGSDDGVRRNSIYYFADEATVREFSKVSEHLEAKKHYRKWYDGYQIIVSEVLASYGDGRLEHILAPGGAAEARSKVVGSRTWKSAQND